MAEIIPFISKLADPMMDMQRRDMKVLLSLFPQMYEDMKQRDRVDSA